MNNFLNYFSKQLRTFKKASPKQMLYAFGIAFICWFVISMTMYSTTPKTISNIPLEIDLSGTSAEVNDLSVISQDVEKVKVQIQGERTEIGNFKSEDLKATAIVENVTQAGTYELSIRVTGVNSGVEFTVNQIEPSSVTVEFDKYISKDIPIEVTAPNIKAKDGYIMDENYPKATPSTITITGPQAQVDSISKFSVSIDQEKELDNYYTYHSTDKNEWTILNESGGEVDTKDLTYDLNSIQIDFQAYMTKTLKLTYSVINAPNSNFNPNFNMSVEEIVVASSDSSLETSNEISIGEIDMKEVDENYSKTFKIELPSSYRNISGIDTVTVSLPSNEYSKREFSNLTNFVLENIPSNYDVEVVTSGLTVELIAPSAIIDDINADDFILKIDLSNSQITGNLFNALVTVQLPNYANSWCIGKYTVVLRASEKTTTTQTDNDTTNNINEYTTTTSS